MKKRCRFKITTQLEPDLPHPPPLPLQVAAARLRKVGTQCRCSQSLDSVGHKDKVYLNGNFLSCFMNKVLIINYLPQSQRGSSLLYLCKGQIYSS